MTSAPVSSSADVSSYSESVSWASPDSDFIPNSNELVESFATDLNEYVKPGEINSVTKEVKQDGEAPTILVNSSDRPKENIDPVNTINEADTETLDASLEAGIHGQGGAGSNPTLSSGIDELCNSTNLQFVVANEPSVDDSRPDASDGTKDKDACDESNSPVSNGPTELHMRTSDLESTAVVFEMTTTTDDSSESSVDIDLSESQHLSFADIVIRPSIETSQINISLESDTLPRTIATGDCPQINSTTVLQPVSNTPKRKHREADIEKQPQSPKRQCQTKNDENARAGSFTSAIGRHFSRAARSAGPRSAVGVSIRIVTSQVMRGNQSC